jgi:holo-[acyl-carrier protein] synthase
MKQSAILGIGVDLVENERLREALDRRGDAFKKRIFLSSEQAYCDGKACPEHHYAGRFAVKEAVAKAFGTGIGASVGWCDIEVATDPETGAPSVHLSEKARRFADQMGVADILISLSHTRHYAVAKAILCRGE